MDTFNVNVQYNIYLCILSIISKEVFLNINQIPGRIRYIQFNLLLTKNEYLLSAQSFAMYFGRQKQGSSKKKKKKKKRSYFRDLSI